MLCKIHVRVDCMFHPLTAQKCCWSKHIQSDVYSVSFDIAFSTRYSNDRFETAEINIYDFKKPRNRYTTLR